MSLAKELNELSQKALPNVAQAEYDRLCDRLKTVAAEGATTYLYHPDANKRCAVDFITTKLEEQGLTVVRSGNQFIRLTITWGAQ